MSLSERLKTMKRYRAQALLDPDNNKLYIEDLNISIAQFEKAIKNDEIQVMNGGFQDA